MAKALGKNEKMLTEEEKNYIVELFLNKNSSEDIRKQLHLTRRCVRNVLKEKNIYSRRKNRYTLNENYFETIDTEHKAYWLGFIASDGCITKTNYFAMSLKDKDILIKLKEDLNYTGEIYEVINEFGIYYRINFSSKKLCDDLRKIGIHENKSLTYNELPKISKNLMPHFIRGYFDGDGCIYKCKSSYTRNNKKYEYDEYRFNIIATEQFCCNLKSYLLNIINYECKIHPHAKSKMFYICIYDNKALLKFYEYIYNNSTIYLERKHIIWKDFLGSLSK